MDDIRKICRANERLVDGRWKREVASVSRFDIHDAGTWIVRRTSIRGGIHEWDIPFEFVGKFSSSSAVAKTGDIEGRSAARHVGCTFTGENRDCKKQMLS